MARNRYIWHTSARGRVYVNDPIGREDYQPYLQSKRAEHMDAHVIPVWKKLCLKVSRSVGVPAAWLLAFVYKESVGYSKHAETELGAAGTRNPALYRDGVLDEAAQETKLLLVAKKLAGHIAALGLDLPAVASAFVVGVNKSTEKPWRSDKSPWGLLEPSGYILDVVSANNYACSKLPVQSWSFPSGETPDKTLN